MEMTRLKGLLARLRKDDNGATMIEYSILIGLITAAAVVAIGAMGGYVTTSWQTLCTATGVAGC
jgi:pilus assembly protein Flp/PilA